MEIIITFSKQVGFESINNGNIEFNFNSWLGLLIERIYPESYNTLIRLIGRDDKGRIELGLDLELFEKLKNDQLFIQKSKTLRRIRSNFKNKLDRVLNSQIKEFDNDLDLLTTKRIAIPHIARQITRLDQ